MPLHISGECMYWKGDREQVHSDICFDLKHNSDDKKEEMRKFLHDTLDEWLDNQHENQSYGVRRFNQFYLMLSMHDH